MKKLFIYFLKNKVFVIWLLLFFIVLYLSFNPLLSFKYDYMNDNSITNIIYIFYVFMLPLTFYEMGFVSCMIIDLCFISILSYAVASFINYFFENSSITLTRIKRGKCVKELYKINFIFSTFLTIIYIILFSLLCLKNNIEINMDINVCIVIGYKLLIAVLVPNIYLFSYIKTNSSISSLGFTYLVYILLELLIKITFIESSLSFKFSIIVLIFIMVIYLLLYKLSNNMFLRRDV